MIPGIIFFTILLKEHLTTTVLIDSPIDATKQYKSHLKNNVCYEYVILNYDLHTIGTF